MSARLRQLDRDLLVLDHPLRVGGLELGTRTSLVRTQGGGLLVHSPGPLAEGVQAEIEKLGPVRALVAPNCLHHMFLVENAAAFPDARVFGPPGVAAKQPRVRFEAPLGDTAPEAFAGELETHRVRGASSLQEIACFHPRSRTLLLTDLAFHVRRSSHLVTRLFMRANGAYGRFGPTRIFRYRVLDDRAALRESLERILAWDFERVVVAHGCVLERGGREAFRAAFEWV